MEILELELKHFGKFQEHKVKLYPGVNIIYGGNETGKSTIHAFIRAMFFGIERGRGKTGRKDEYQLRQPWDNPAYFAGTMRVKYRGDVYRIERNFYKNDKQVQLVCETRGQQLPAGQQELSRLLAGMNEAAFRNTVFIPQAGAETDAGLAEELQKFMVNFQETGDGNLDVARAVERLKGQKKELESRKKQEQELLDEKIARKQLEADYVRRELEQLSAAGEGPALSQEPERNQKIFRERKEGLTEEDPKKTETNVPGEKGEEGLKLQAEKRNNEAGLKANEQERHPIGGSYRRFLLWLNVLLFLCGVLGAACGYFAGALGKKLLLYGVGLLFFALFGMTCRCTIKIRKTLFPAGENGERDGWERDRKEPDFEEEPERQREHRVLRKLWEKLTAIPGEEEEFTAASGKGEEGRREAMSREYGKASDGTAPERGEEQREASLNEEERLWKEEARKKELQEKTIRLETIQQEMEALYGEREKLAAYDCEAEAIDLAMARIQEISARIYQEAGTEFGQKASEILSELTEGRYTSIALDEKMQVRINTPSRLLYLSQVSYGTMNQIYFALRIAAGELLAFGEPLPILLDEAFAMYDDERLEAALRWLHRSGRQVILFTCQQREKIILDRIRRRI